MGERGVKSLGAIRLFLLAEAANEGSSATETFFFFFFSMRILHWEAHKMHGTQDTQQIRLDGDEEIPRPQRSPVSCCSWLCKHLYSSLQGRLPGQVCPALCLPLRACVWVGLA